MNLEKSIKKIHPHQSTRPIHTAASTSGFRSVVNFMVSSLLLLAALLLWRSSLQNADPARMNDFGLVSVLPAAYFVALGLLTLSFIWTLRRPALNQVLLLLHLTALIFIIHGTPQILYGTLRYSWAWKHLGIIDYIQRHGTVNPSIHYLNAYHNWPGFFTLAAFINQVAGLNSSLRYAGWAPVFFNLLDLAVLFVIYKTLTPNRRLVWLAAWLFYLTNWVGQDYFSPQAMGFFLYLVVIAAVLKWFRSHHVPTLASVKRWLPGEKLATFYHRMLVRSNLANPPEEAGTARQRVALMSVVILVCAVIASSHQLTPLMAVSALTLLVLFMVTDQPYLPLLMAAFTVIWVVFMAVGFLNANLPWVVRSFGLFSENIQSNLINLSDASSSQQVIAWIDRGLTLSVWVLGGLGVLRRYRAGHFDLPAFLMAAAPFPMLVVNSYGGEMLFRVYLFSLPFMIFFAAGLLVPGVEPNQPARIKPIITTAVSLTILTGFLFGYYGKDRMFYFTKNEVAAAQYLVDNAPYGSLILDGTWDWPKNYANYEFYDYTSLATLNKKTLTELAANPLQVLIPMMDKIQQDSVASYFLEDYLDAGFMAGGAVPGRTYSDKDYPAAYFILTRSQLAESEMTGVFAQGQLVKIKQALMNSHQFKVVFQTNDAVVIQFIDTPEDIYD